MAFFDWVHSTEIYKEILFERDVTEFNEKQLNEIPENLIQDFVDRVNEDARNTREQYVRFLEGNPEYKDSQETFEIWYNIKTGINKLFSPDKENREEKQSKKIQVTDDEEPFETYGEYLMRTGLPDTKQNYKIFIYGFPEDVFT